MIGLCLIGAVLLVFSNTDKETAPTAKSFEGTVEESYDGKVVLRNDSKARTFHIDENTEMNLGEAPWMYMGDTILIIYHPTNRILVADKVELISRDLQLGDFAASLCWPYDQKKEGRYDGGSMTESYAKWYKKLHPNNDSGIKGTQWNAGASCDLLVATALRAFGVYDFPVTLATQCDYFFLSDDYEKYFEKIESDGSADSMQHGDIVICINRGSENNGQGHIFVVNKTDGNNWRSNAHYRLDNGYYGVIDDSHDYPPGKYKYFGIFRLK